MKAKTIKTFIKTICSIFILSQFYLFQPLSVFAAAPSAPTYLTATGVSTTQIDLSWQDNSTDETGFKIERSKSSTGPFVQIGITDANVTIYSSTALSPNTTYWHRIRSYNTDGDSIYSNRANATTTQAVPAAPSNLSGTAVSTSQIDLSWTDNSANEDGFKIERAQSQEGPFTQITQTNPNTTAHSDQNLALHTLYYYRVFAYNSAGNSNYAAISAATKLDKIPNPSIIGFIPDVGAVQDVVVSQDGTKAYLASNPFGLVTLDISNIQSPKVISSQRPSVGPAGHLAISSDGQTAVAAGTPRGADIIDVSNPIYPKVLASVPGNSADAAISGNIAYIVAQGDVKLVDISQPANPVLVTTLITPNIATGIAVSGNTAVVTDSLYGNVRVVDISNPTSPTIVGSVSLGGLSGKVAITEVDGKKYGLVANTSLGQLQIIDISTPSSPQVKGSINTGSAQDVTASGAIAYVSAGGSGLAIIDISDPSSPTSLSNFKDGYAVSSSAVSGNTVFVAHDTYGVALANISNPRIPSKILDITSSSSAGQLVISPDGKIVIAAGTPRGADIIDVSNPIYPKVLASVPGNSADAAISGSIAYVVSGGDVKVIDITQPSNPILVTTLTIPGMAQGIAISGNIAVVTDILPNNIRVVDISNLTAPAIVGSASLDGMPGKVAITEIGGIKYGLVANTSLGKLQIIDINTPSNPQLVGSISTGSAQNVTAVGTTAYVSGNDLDIVDISNPASPTLLATYDSHGTTAASVSSGNIAYLTSAVGVARGIVILDVSTPMNPRKIVNIPSLGDADDVIVSGNKIYVADNKAELVIMDIYHDGIDVLKTADKYSVKSGHEVTYTLTLNNTSPNTLTNLNLSDVIPAGTSYVSGSASGNGSYSSLAKKIIWTYSSISPNQTITETFKVRVE